MSGDDELDKLIFSMPNIPKKKKREDKEEKHKSEEPGSPKTQSSDSGDSSGSDPLDVVSLHGQERKLIAWLTRHPQSTIIDIQNALKLPQENLETLLGELLEKRRIQSEERDGETYYYAPLRGKASRRLRGFPDDLWKKAGLDDD